MPVELEQMQRLNTIVRRSRAVAEMSKDEIDQMAAVRMGAEHSHLNALLDEEQPTG
jgi:hypothetical protein